MSNNSVNAYGTEDHAISNGDFITFPSGFLWGAATSHFQIEGHPVEFGKRLSDWSEWVSMDGKIADQTVPDSACEFFKRHSADIAICKQLNLNAFRISLNWPILCPEEPRKGQAVTLDPDGVEYYRKILSSMKEEGIQTFVTLFHFTLPTWLSQQGGWSDRSIVDAFTVFTDLAARAFGDLVDFWITLNEPLAYAYQGYVAGIWPPGKLHDYLGAFKTVRYMLEAHAKAYAVLHENNKNAQVGFAMHWRPFVGKQRWNPLDNMVAYYRNQVFNKMFPIAAQSGELSFPYPIDSHPEVQRLSGVVPGLKGTMDFIGLNYYTRELSKFVLSWPIDIFGVKDAEPEFDTNCLGWEVYPDGLYQALTSDLCEFARNPDGSKRPIYITENGFPTQFESTLHEGDWSLADDVRVNFLRMHLLAVHRAIKDGANVKGYLYWSLLDNFEWADGLAPRFGLVRVSYPTQERTLRRSAILYADIAKRNGLEWAAT